MACESSEELKGVRQAFHLSIAIQRDAHHALHGNLRIMRSSTSSLTTDSPELRLTLLSKLNIDAAITSYQRCKIIMYPIDYLHFQQVCRDRNGRVIN
jgi:hypothetical protein